MESRSKITRSGFSEIYQREIGLSQSRSFAHRITGSEAIVEQIDLYGKLNAHDGCVNTVHFNSTGDFIVSGSDDTQVIFWDWAAKSKRLAYSSGHSDNIFQARIMPFTDDRTVITSAADGQVRLGQVRENGEVETKRLGKHQGSVHNLAIEPGSPHIFYSCGEDGFVQQFDLRSCSSAKLFACSSLKENKRPGIIRLNAIVIDPRNPTYFAVGGYDGYARVYDIRSYQQESSSSDSLVKAFCPPDLLGTDNIHITGLAYSNSSELLVSYNDELVYLFQKNMGLGSNPHSVSPENLKRLDRSQVYSGHRNSQTVKGVSFFGHSDEYVVSGSDCGHIFIWKKSGELVRLMVGDKHIVNCLVSHPFLPVLATSGIEKNVKIWVPMASDRSPLPENVKEIMEANKQGREDRSRITLTPDVIMHVLRLQRRQPLTYIDRRYTRSDLESDEEDEGETRILGFADDDASSEGGFTNNSRDCNIS
ncbi:DDB1- and CUL4-associated factor 8-like [Papaver somniferum]|uniref:DDB1- and CUL4-associated factor 8-like n=1 Tax=Papaver somniferum TaxID=3469 RepID=UPI000E6FB7AA|nr:DDB1- and CUL4-associated factor 8-like [Papaver somniferum]